MELSEISTTDGDRHRGGSEATKNSAAANSAEETNRRAPAKGIETARQTGLTKYKPLVRNTILVVSCLATNWLDPSHRHKLK